MAIVKEKIGIGKSRTYELLQIADGRKTVEEVRADAAERKGRHLSVPNGQGRELVVSEPAGAEVMPTEEEAEESYQETLYDHACLFLERMTGETRQRVFAHIRGKYQAREAGDNDAPALRALIYKRMVEGLSLILASPKGRDLTDDFLREVFEEFLSKSREVLPRRLPKAADGLDIPETPRRH